MGYSVNPNGSDFIIVTDVLLYSVFATLAITPELMGSPYVCLPDFSYESPFLPGRSTSNLSYTICSIAAIFWMVGC